MLVVHCMVVCVRTGLTAYTGSTVTGGLCQDWCVSQRIVVYVRTGLSAYAGSTVYSGLCQDWSVSVCW